MRGDGRIPTVDQDIHSGAEGLESHQFKQAGGSEEGRSDYAEIPPDERRGY